MPFRGQLFAAARIPTGMGLDSMEKDDICGRWLQTGRQIFIKGQLVPVGTGEGLGRPKGIRRTGPFSQGSSPPTGLP